MNPSPAQLLNAFGVVAPTPATPGIATLMAWKSFSTWACALQLEGVAAHVAGLGRRRCAQLRIQRVVRKAFGLAGPGHPGCCGRTPAPGGGPSLADSIEGEG
ncbi:hypothetical protein TraAM80_10013 [Trypanosoma rangeli]|uniref:Uncharacterized protein n=1 Tax=Trypanosoma rangeli TaxID=5698 RepID=A0A3R7MVY0_TRYRA|nr:uncharacterized protein TraAM80_10013 [Trypanosoma rangeli]RNE96126.1 hypothetical protein TraAM80_10013 [Trypanosoma rangeli]|eukprot:RNE96126.1 hypothetical protein TraAM80_10013 [Trypanosoma rangeli]